MTFIYARGNPDNLVSGVPANMGDIQGPFYDVRDYLNSIAVGKPPLVSALPPAPADGDEVYYVADGVNGIIWHLRYNAAGSAYKWEWLGGGYLRADVATDEGGLPNGAPGDLATVGPTVTAPLAGEYTAKFGCNFNIGGGTNGLLRCSLFYGPAAATQPNPTYDATALETYPNFFHTIRVRSVEEVRMTLAVNDLVRLKYAIQTGTSLAVSARERHMAIRPLRVG